MRSACLILTICAWATGNALAQAPGPNELAPVSAGAVPARLDEWQQRAIGTAWTLRLLGYAGTTADCVAERLADLPPQRRLSYRAQSVWVDQLLPGLIEACEARPGDDESGYATLARSAP
jgi:hypothetical protein